MKGYDRLKDQVAIVTGGARGIGFAIATKLTAEGAKILIADILEKESRESVSKLRNEGYDADYFILDIRNVKEIHNMVDYCVKKLGKLDILINNAGISAPCPSMKLSEEDFDRVMDINLKGAFFASQAAGRVMRKDGGGKIVSISSASSIMANIGSTPYCISKAGINSMTSVLGAEWALYNIRVNAIGPGWVKTDLVKKIGLATKRISEEQIFSVLPVERWGTEEEIANLACYLCSDESTYINGQTIFCDGGLNAGMWPNALDYIKKYDTVD